MKAEILKIAGVKSEKEFYKKYPTEESFMKVHGKAFKKAQFGTGVPGDVDTSLGTTYPNNDDLSYIGQDELFNNNNSGYAFTGGPDTRTGGLMGGGSDKLMKAAGGVGKIIGGIQAFEAEKEQRRGAEQMKAVSDIMLKASATRPEQIKRTYNRPEDNVFSTSSLFPAYGVGSNVLAEYGGDFKKAQNGGGFTNFLNSGGADSISSFLDFGTGNNAGGSLGGSIGSLAGSAFGPLGGQVGQMVGTLAGGLLDQNKKRTKKAQEATMRNMQGIIGNNMGASIQAGNASFLKYGGTSSPQLMKSFEGVTANDLRKLFSDMDTLRTGGNLRQNNMTMLEEGGDLQILEGGYAEPISYNPHLPGEGETVMFRGNSHDEGGIPLTFGGNPVEVERGEPALKMIQDGQEALTVFGDLNIPKEFVSTIGDKNAKGKKFKNYVADLSKKEAKQTKLINKTTDQLNELDPITSIDKLKLSSLKANMLGANMKLKEIADFKNNAAMVQSAINDTAKEYGVDAAALAKNKIKPIKPSQGAKYGGKFKSYQNSDDPIPTYKQTDGRSKEFSKKANLPGNLDYNDPSEAGDAFKDYEKWKSKVNTAFDDPEIARRIVSNLENYSGQDAADTRKIINSQGSMAAKIEKARQLATDGKVGPFHIVMDAVIDASMKAPGTTLPMPKAETPVKQIDPNYEVIPHKRSTMVDVLGQLLPYVRPSDVEALDANQLLGEMYALSNNQVEPVQTQSYQPELGVPYDISYQDLLNQNQADFRAATRQTGFNPAVASYLAAEKYGANERVLGQQFRENQAMKDRVYSDNRNILNDAKLKNIQLYDTQYQRQSQALSNTKATAQAAINSISDKIAKNKLENRTLAVYENMYNYRYDPAFRAINMNAPYQFNIPQKYTPGEEAISHVPMYDSRGKIIGYKPVPQEEYNEYEEIKPPSMATPKTTAKHGSILKSFRNF